MIIQTIRNEKLTSSLLQEISEKYCAKKIFLIHGKKSFSVCGAKEVFDSAFKGKFQTMDFTGFSENPKLEDIQNGIALAAEFRPDIIFGIGGGSAMDVAKLIRLRYEEKRVPLCLIPTTAGTGAESTRFVVCYENGEKKSIASDDMLADVAVLDWTFTKTNSDYTAACAGFDALAQAIESFWSVKSTEKSRALAKQVMEIIFPLLGKRDLYRTDDFRKQMILGANLAGQAINITTTTACHAFSYKITSLLGLPHGHAVAVSLPYFSDYLFSNAEGELKDIMQNLFGILGITGEPRMFLSDYVKKVFSGLYTPRIPTDDEWKMIVGSVNKERLANYPVPLGVIEKSDFVW